MGIVAQVSDVAPEPGFVFNIFCDQVVKSYSDYILQTLRIENKRKLTDSTQAFLQNMTNRCSPLYLRRWTTFMIWIDYSPDFIELLFFAGEWSTLNFNSKRNVVCLK